MTMNKNGGQLMEELIIPGKIDYEAVFQRSSVIFCIIDFDEKIKQANDSFLKLFLTGEEILYTKKFTELFDHVEAKRISSLLFELKEGLDPVNNQNKFTTRLLGGTYNWDFNIDFANRLIYIIGHEIADEKEYERMLVDANNRYYLVNKATSEAIYDWEIGSEYCFWHGENFKKLFGVNRSNCYMSMTIWMSFLHPDDRNEVWKSVSEAINNGSTFWTDQYRFLKSNGEVVYVLDRAYIERDHTGKPLRVIGAMGDITPQKQAEAALFESEKSYRKLFNSAPLPQLIFDKNSLKILKVNNTSVQHYGYTDKEFLNLSFNDLIHQQQYTQMLNKIKDLNVKHKPYKVITTHRKKNGEVIKVECTAISVTYNDHEAILMMIYDITEKVKLQHELTRNKINQQKQLTSAIIKAQERERTQLGLELHDNINQILTSAKLYNEMYYTGAVNDKEILNKAINYLQNCINDIRDISKRLSTPTLGDISLIDSVNELIESINLLKTITVECKFINIQDCVITEEFHLTLYRIVQEQLNNILKHSKATKVEIQLNNKKANFTLIIKDNGVGFNNRSNHTGIGLKNIKSRVENMNGQLYITSNKNEGCEVKAIFPCIASLQIEETTDHEFTK